MAGGRPKGIPKTGGRKKGTPNKVTLAQVRAFSELGKEALPDSVLKAMKPVDVLLMVMRKAVKAGNMPVALQAAEKAAPYCHARLQNVSLDATVRRGASDFSDAELAALASGEQTQPEPGEDEATGQLH